MVNKYCSTFTIGEWYSYFCTGKKKNSKQKRLLYDCFQHFVLNYPFLDETQQWGKAYQLLGIPYLCGKVDKEKLKKMYAEVKKDNARMTKLKVLLKPGKVTINNQICEKDWKCLEMRQQQSQLLPSKEMRKPYSNEIVNNRKPIKNNQISHDKPGTVLDQVDIPEIQSQKRVRFNNVQILCFDNPNFSESEVSTDTLLSNETSKQKVDNKHERIIHKPYFERLNDSISSSESNTDNEVNNNNLPSASDSLREAESEFNLNKQKTDHEDGKEVPTTVTQSNESDIRKLLAILSDDNDNRILSPCDQTCNEDFDIYSNIGTKIKIIPPFPSGIEEEEDTLSSDSLMNDYDTGIMSPYTTDDELGTTLDDIVHNTTIREQDEEILEKEVSENNDKLNDNQGKPTIILEVKNSASDKLSEVIENKRELTSEKIDNISDEDMINFGYLFSDKIHVSDKNINNDVDNEISKIKHQNNNKEKQKESKDNYSSGNIQEKFVNNSNLPRDRKCEENVAEDQNQSQENVLISPLSSESTVVERFFSLIPSGDLISPIIGNIEHFRFNSSASFSQQNSVVQEEFGFGSVTTFGFGTIDKRSVLDKDNENEQILSSDSFNRISSNEERINSDSNEELLNDSNKKNLIEIRKKRVKSESFPIIISATDSTTTGNSENIIQSSLIVDSDNKREPLRLISNVLCNGKKFAEVNINRNSVHRDKENVTPDMSDQISPKKNMSKEVPPKSSFIPDSGSHELDIMSGLEEVSSHDEHIVRSSCRSKTATDNNGTDKMGKVSESESSEKKSSLRSDIGRGKNYKQLFQNLKNSTNENPNDKNKLILSREASSPEEGREETCLADEVILLSDNSDVLSISSEDLNNEEKDDEFSENLQEEEPNICESVKTKRVFKDISSTNIPQNVNETTQMPTRQLSSKTAPMTINSSDSWSGNEHLLMNFNKRICDVGKKEKQAISKKSSDYCFENLNDKDINFAEGTSRETMVRTIISVLNDSNLSSPKSKGSDEESEQFNINSTFGELSIRPGKFDVTDFGTNAFFNEQTKISLESSSNSNILGTPNENKHQRFSPPTQQINNLNFINLDTSRNCVSPLMSNAAQLDPKNYSLSSSNDNVMEKNIDINKRESVTRMNVSGIMENKLDSIINPITKYKRKMTDTIVDKEYHDSHSSSDSSIVLPQKNIKRRRKKGRKLENLPCKRNNKHETSDDDTEFINENKIEKLKLTSKKTTTKPTAITKPMFISAINEIAEKKTTGVDQQKMQSVNNINNSSDMIDVDNDCMGGHSINQEVNKLRRTSIVKLKINSTNHSPITEHIDSALARRMYYFYD